MITTAIYFNVVWFGFTGVDLQPQVMSPRAISSKLKEVVHKGFLPRVLLLSQLHFYLYIDGGFFFTEPSGRLALCACCI